MKKAVLPIVICLMFIAGCKKVTTPSLTTEHPMQNLLNQTSVVDTNFIFQNGQWEWASKLYFSRNGNITKLGCKLGALGSYRVALWDFDAHNVIAVTTVSIIDTTQFAYNIISPISVTANTRYILSVNNANGSLAKLYYVYYKKSNVAHANIYPFTSGSVTYESSYGYLGADLHFPTLYPSSDAIIGIADLQFEHPE